jgi:hypothetical protein
VRGVNNGDEYRINTGGAVPSLSSDNSRLMWVNTGLAVPGSTRPQARVFIASPSGSFVQEVIAAPGADARWLDATRLLLSVPGEARSVELSVYDTQVMSGYSLGIWSWIRNLTIAPGGGRILFYVTNQPNAEENGLVLLETRPNTPVQRLAWFGGWRWRDASSIYYIPLDITTPLHTLRYYNVETGEDLALITPEQQPFTVMNGNWSVSADGTRIVFNNGVDDALTLLERFKPTPP